MVQPPVGWTDYTFMAVVIAESVLGAVSDGRAPVDDMSLSAIVQGWTEWASGAREIGMKAGAVLSRVNQLLGDRPELVDREPAYAAARRSSSRIPPLCRQGFVDAHRSPGLGILRE